MYADLDEVLRYLRCKNPDANLIKEIEEVGGEVENGLHARHVYGRFETEKTDDGIRLKGTDITFSGSLVTERLKNSFAVYLVAVTLGLPSENYAARYHKNMSRAVIADACMTAFLERTLDGIEEGFRKKENTSGYTVTARFSPGYGDFPLESQRGILRLLQAEKLLGIRLNDSLMLYPNKTVTAMMGVTVLTDCKTKKQGCSECQSYGDCPYGR